MEFRAVLDNATQAQLKQLFAVNKICVFPGVGSWIALAFLVAFSTAIIALSPDLSFEMSFVYGLLPSFLIIPFLIWISSLKLIASNRFSKRFIECLLLVMFYIPMFVSLLVFGTTTMWMTTKIPLADNLLDGWDKTLGLDWIGYTNWLVEHPQLMSLCSQCYVLLCPALLIVGLEAIIVGEPDRCKSLIFLTLSTCIFSIAVGSFFPVYGSVVHLASVDLRAHLPPGTGTDQMEMLIKIRGGVATHIDPRKLVGLVSFPSFHTIACMLLIYGSRGNILRLGVVSVFSVMMVGAIPVFGQHYLVDLLFGASVAIVFIFIERWFRARRASLELA
jgi:PAP2 superfamily